MKLKVPNTTMEFEVPDEWWSSAGMKNFVPNAEHYQTDLSACSEVIPFGEVEPPLRNDGFLFRNRESVIHVLSKMRTGEQLAPIEVWSRAKSNSQKWIVRDDFHRFYLSIAAGYTKLPVRVNDFDLKEFLKKERG